MPARRSCCRDHLLVGVIRHDLSLEPDRMVVDFNMLAWLLLRLLGVELRIVLGLLDRSTGDSRPSYLQPDWLHLFQ